MLDGMPSNSGWLLSPMACRDRPPPVQAALRHETGISDGVHQYDPRHRADAGRDPKPVILAVGLGEETRAPGSGVGIHMEGVLRARAHAAVA